MCDFFYCYCDDVLMIEFCFIRLPHICISMYNLYPVSVFVVISRPYAEHIESKIKANGLLTSLNLLQDKSMLPRVLEDVAQRNVPFAVIVNSDNEVHSSLTVNILHGTPQGNVCTK